MAGNICRCFLRLAWSVSTPRPRTKKVSRTATRRAIPVPLHRMFFIEHKADHCRPQLITLHGSPLPLGLDLAPSILEPHGTREPSSTCNTPADLCTNWSSTCPISACHSITELPWLPPKTAWGKPVTLMVSTMQDYWEHPTKSVCLEVWSGTLVVPKLLSGGL